MEVAAEVVESDSGVVEAWNVVLRHPEVLQCGAGRVFEADLDGLIEVGDGTAESGEFGGIGVVLKYRCVREGYDNKGGGARTVFGWMACSAPRRL